MSDYSERHLEEAQAFLGHHECGCSECESVATLIAQAERRGVEAGVLVAIRHALSTVDADAMIADGIKATVLEALHRLNTPESPK